MHRQHKSVGVSDWLPSSLASDFWIVLTSKLTSCLVPVQVAFDS